MKVGMVTASIGSAGAGVYQVIKQLSDYLVRDFDVSVLGNAQAGSTGEKFNIVDLRYPERTNVLLRRLGYLPSIADELEALEPDVVHVHGIWMLHAYFSRSYCFSKGVPMIISPHGMCDPWIVNQSKILKRAYYYLIERGNFNAASCVHALNVSEYKSLRKMGVKSPVAIIPNGIAFDEDVNLVECSEMRSSSNKKSLLFLGRIHRKKGIFDLIDAWALMPKDILSDWQLDVFGWGSAADENALRLKMKDVGSATFHGEVHGQKKHDVLSNASAFVLPSYSEGLPMAVLEAWYYGIPAIISPYCNLEDAYDLNAAIKTDVGVEGIKSSLLHALSLDDLSYIGSQGSKLVRERYTWDVVSKMHADVYQWVSGGLSKPACVVLD